MALSAKGILVVTPSPRCLTPSEKLRAKWANMGKEYPKWSSVKLATMLRFRPWSELAIWLMQT
jgi:hypothetical protein